MTTFESRKKSLLRRWWLSWFGGWLHCPTCNAFIPAYNMGIHSDWHFQQEMQGLYESLPLTGAETEDDPIWP